MLLWRLMDVKFFIFDEKVYLFNVDKLVLFCKNIGKLYFWFNILIRFILVRLL